MAKKLGQDLTFFREGMKPNFSITVTDLFSYNEDNINTINSEAILKQTKSFNFNVQQVD